MTGDDHVLARDLAAGKIGAQYLPKLLAVCERFEDIDFDRLPDKFVIKANHGTHWVLLVENKAALDRTAARNLVNGWLKTDYYVNSREFFYKNIKPRIMIEEFLQEASGEPLIDYRFFVFDGVRKLAPRLDYTSAGATLKSAGVDTSQPAGRGGRK